MYKISDKDIEQDLLALEHPITDSVEELRAAQVKADFAALERKRKGNEPATNNWFVQDGNCHILHICACMLFAQGCAKRLILRKCGGYSVTCFRQGSKHVSTIANRNGKEE